MTPSDAISKVITLWCSAEIRLQQPEIRCLHGVAPRHDKLLSGPEVAGTERLTRLAQQRSKLSRARIDVLPHVANLNPGVQPTPLDIHDQVFDQQVPISEQRQKRASRRMRATV